MKKFLPLPSLLSAAILLSFVNGSAAATYNIQAGHNGTYSSTADQASVTSSSYNAGVNTTGTAIYANSDVPWGSPGLSAGSTGSGVYTDLFRFQANNTEKGYNSQTGNPHNQSNGVGILTLQVKDANVVTYNGVSYFEFLFDGNENDNAVSLDEFLLFTSPNSISGTATTSNPTQAQVLSFFQNSTNNATLRYSLDSLDSSGNVTNDNTVLFFAGGGSGKGDEGIYIPTSLMNSDYLYHYFYIWVRMGGAGTVGGVDFSSSGGFEEVAYFRQDQGGTPYGSLVPEFGATGAAFLLFGAVLVRRRRCGAGAV